MHLDYVYWMLDAQCESSFMLYLCYTMHSKRRC